MSPSAGRLRLTLRRGSLVLAVLVILIGAFAFRRAGTFLIHADPPQKADALFVLGGTKYDRPLEAVNLYKAGWAPLIVLSPGNPEWGELTLRSRGVRVWSDAQLARDAMMQLGVPESAILMPGGSIDNTAQEAALLRRLAAEYNWHSIIIVTSKFHSRRSAFAFHRAFRGSPVRISIQPAVDDGSDPEHWWRRRADIRFVTSEWQKLVLYWIGLSE